MARAQYSIVWNHTRNWWDVIDVRTGARVRHFDTRDAAEAYLAKLAK